MKTITAALILSLAAALPANIAAAQERYEVARDTPPWFKESFLDFEEDVAEANDDGKQMMVYFGQDGCPYCKVLHEVNFRQSDIVQTLRDSFDAVAVNMFGDVETIWTDGDARSEKELAQYLNIQFTPTLLFLDDSGKEVLRLAGYQPPRKFMTALQYVRDGAPGNFADYLHQHLPPNTTAKAPPYPKAFIKPPHNFSAPGQKVAVLITQSECQACDEWRHFLAGDGSKEWRQKNAVAEVSMHGKEKINGSDSAAWVREQNIPFVPALIFLDADGGEIFRADGYLRSFHLGSLLEYVEVGAQKTEPEFQRFIQKRADQMRADGIEVVIY